MRKSGHNAGTRGSFCLLEGDDDASDFGNGRNCRPKRKSHSGPERYVIVAISVPNVRRTTTGNIKSGTYVEPISCQYVEEVHHSKNLDSSWGRP
jgi:hypothetical protein